MNKLWQGVWQSVNIVIIIKQNLRVGKRGQKSSSSCIDLSLVPLCLVGPAAFELLTRANKLHYPTCCLSSSHFIYARIVVIIVVLVVVAMAIIIIGSVPTFWILMFFFSNSNNIKALRMQGVLHNTPTGCHVNPFSNHRVEILFNSSSYS